MRVVVVLCCALALLAGPSAALADPGHGPSQPHLNQAPSADSGGGGSGLVIGVTLVTLIVLAASAAALKRAGRR